MANESFCILVILVGCYIICYRSFILLKRYCQMEEACDSLQMKGMPWGYKRVFDKMQEQKRKTSARGIGEERTGFILTFYWTTIRVTCPMSDHEGAERVLDVTSPVAVFLPEKISVR